MAFLPHFGEGNAQYARGQPAKPHVDRLLSWEHGELPARIGPQGIAKCILKALCLFSLPYYASPARAYRKARSGSSGKGETSEDGDDTCSCFCHAFCLCLPCLR